ncbi:transmembrane protein, putative (macronuclear) [Tetrahymena thermophila SB210]|uniref:Transmembrane protein, putative n=1 Tax=Tetrahymena thermophila (strain SB210) TaxID=312017 RepID=I7MFV6_TETTS|nr:transmembrane protein, putative [Tetrahymena thermophila SB210]EAS00638.1 transmembrane protein, putative [Tetrahymena thermophila SB210]|eukprot:XP_001020883.1 transmembrane protein, putative [Tetrahymena thermophila SB210]
MELQQQKSALFAQFNNHINDKGNLIEQLKELSQKEGYGLNSISDNLYSIEFECKSPEAAIESLKAVNGITVSIPHKTISLSTSKITQNYLQRKLKVPIDSLELANGQAHITFETIEDKQEALKKIFADRKLKKLVILDSLTTHIQNDLSTDNSSFSSRSSIECSPLKVDQPINGKRRGHLLIENVHDEVIQQYNVQQNSDEEQGKEEELSLSLENENIQVEDKKEEKQLDESENQDSALEPQIQKKRKLEQGFYYLEQGFEYVLLITLMTILALKLFKGISY